MNVHQYSTSSLFMMHDAIRDALIADISSGEERYGVRLCPDCTVQRDAFEAELRARGAAFVAIVW